MTDRSELIALLQSSADLFADSFRTLGAAQFNFRPDPAKWSIALTAEHVIWAETGAAKLLKGRLVKELAPAEVLAATVGREELIDERLAPRGTPFSAPDIVVPTGRWTTPDEMLGVFRESRAATIEFLSTTELDLSKYAAPHPAFGPLTGWQWVRFMVRHCIRHVDQIEGIKQHPDYPR